MVEINDILTLYFVVCFCYMVYGSIACGLMQLFIEANRDTIPLFWRSTYYYCKGGYINATIAHCNCGACLASGQVGRDVIHSYVLLLPGEMKNKASFH